MKIMALCIPPILSFLACSPSCEQQGGKLVQDGVFYVAQTVGGITYMQPYPTYVCKKEKNK
jgi:hypothetical protein